MKRFLIIIGFIAFINAMQGHSYGSLSGVVTGSNDSLPIKGVQVFVKTQKGLVGAVTDNNGYFTVKPLKSGEYTLFVKHIGYQDLTIIGVKVRKDSNTNVGKLVLEIGVDLTVCEIFGDSYNHIIEPGGDPFLCSISCLILHPKIELLTINSIKLPIQQWEKMPQPSTILNVVTSLSTDYIIEEHSSMLHFRGSRSGSSLYIIDGVRVEDLQGVPSLGIGKMTVYTGGFPARYGDFTGGVIVVETMGYFDWLRIKMLKNKAYRASM